MGRWLLALLIVVPALEIWLLIEVGQRIGGWATFALLILTGIVGVYFSRKEAARIWGEAQRQMSMGQMPGKSILDGLCVFVGGVLLIVPGFLTDIAGLILVLPITRPLLGQLIINWLRKKVDSGQSVVFFRRF